jgi:hypothetical protein
MLYTTIPHEDADVITGNFFIALFNDTPFDEQVHWNGTPGCGMATECTTCVGGRNGASSSFR